MSKVYLTVYLTRFPQLGQFPATYSVGTGPGRAEGHGFKTVKEAREWAKKWGHEVVALKPTEVR